MYECASFSEENSHLDILGTLVSLGCDFSTTTAPNFKSWPEPCVHAPEYSPWHHYPPDDPFYIDYVGAILRVNPGKLTAS